MEIKFLLNENDNQKYYQFIDPRISKNVWVKRKDFREHDPQQSSSPLKFSLSAVT